MEKFDISVQSGLLHVTYGYNQNKANILNSLNFRWRRRDNSWSHSIEKLQALVDRIKVYGGLLSLSDHLQELTGLNEEGYTPQELHDREHMWDGHPSFAAEPPADFDFSSIGFKDDATPYLFQLSAIHYGINIALGRVLLADDMGLGKTLQAIALLSYYREDLPAVIVAPASLLYGWKKEILKWVDWISEEDIHVMDSSKDTPKGLVSICSYHYSHTNSEKLVDFMNSRGVIIFDEAQALKSMESLRGAAGVRLAHFSKRCFMLSGTPMDNKPIELFPLLHALDPVEWSDEYEFAVKYCEAHEIPSNTKNKELYTAGACNLNELMQRMRDTVMVRRHKKTVYSQLPKKRRYSQTLNATNNDRDLSEFTDLVTDMAAPILAETKFNVAETVKKLRGKLGGRKGRVFEAFQKAGLSKVNNIVEYILDQMDSRPDEPIVIFAHHKQVIAGIEAGLVKRDPKLKYIKIDGSVTNKKKRFELAETFQEDSRYKVALLSFGAAATGLTLTRAKRTFMAEMPWSPSICFQAEDRINRLGQDQVTEMIYLLGYNGFDDFLWNMIQGKSLFTREALDGAQGDVFEVTDSANEEFDFSADDLLYSMVESLADTLSAPLAA